MLFGGRSLGNVSTMAAPIAAKAGQKLGISFESRLVLIMSAQLPTVVPNFYSVSPMPQSARCKDDVIKIRASAEAKAILNRAAAIRG